MKETLLIKAVNEGVIAKGRKKKYYESMKFNNRNTEAYCIHMCVSLQ
jgi:hypothetical protein